MYVYSPPPHPLVSIILKGYLKYLFHLNLYFLGVDDRVKAGKRKSGDLGFEEAIKKKQKNGNQNLKKNTFQQKRKHRHIIKVYNYFPEIHF